MSSSTSSLTSTICTNGFRRSASTSPVNFTSGRVKLPALSRGVISSLSKIVALLPVKAQARFRVPLTAQESADIGRWPCHGPAKLREQPDGGLLDKLVFGVGVGHGGK